MYDTTRPSDEKVVISTSKGKVAICPQRAALIVIDMQNAFIASSNSLIIRFLAEEMGRGPGGRNLAPILSRTISAMRAKGIRIVWLNWGIGSDLSEIPQNVCLKCSGRKMTVDSERGLFE
jgi:nicotinamidase-related amidase